MRKLPEPLNANEEFLACIAERLDVLIKLLDKTPEQIKESVVEPPIKAVAEKAIVPVKRTRKAPIKKVEEGEK